MKDVVHGRMIFEDKYHNYFRVNCTPYSNNGVVRKGIFIFHNRCGNEENKEKLNIWFFICSLVSETLKVFIILKQSKNL